MNHVEMKRNLLNLGIRELLSVVDMIDGLNGEYVDYKENTLNEEEFLNEQIELVNLARKRLINLFKE